MRACVCVLLMMRKMEEGEGGEGSYHVLDGLDWMMTGFAEERRKKSESCISCNVCVW